MTLVLTLVTTRYVMQVADRLVTVGGNKFDPASNKSLIYVARNAIVTIGYSGLAYLDGIPTDEWIAQTLWGKELPRHDDGRAVGHVLGGGTRQSIDIGRAIERIRCESQKALRNDPAPLKAKFLQIVLAGWQWRRMGSQTVWRPILYAIRSEQQNGRIRCDVGNLPRYWHYERELRDGKSCRPFHMLPVPFTKDTPDPRAAELITRLGPVAHIPDTARQTLVKEIQTRAASKPTIGKDCMCIYMPFPPSSGGVVETDYISAEYEPRIPAWGEIYTASFSPWIIGPASLHAPSIFMGMLKILIGPFIVRLRSPSPPKGPGPRLTGASFSQKRKPKP